MLDMLLTESHVRGIIYALERGKDGSGDAHFNEGVDAGLVLRLSQSQQDLKARTEAGDPRASVAQQRGGKGAFPCGGRALVV